MRSTPPSRPRRSATAAISLAAIALLAGATARADDGPPELSIDGPASKLTVKVWKDGLLSGFGHDHVIEARRLEGAIAWDAARPERGHVRFEVTAASLEVVDPGVDEDDLADIKENMDEDVLEVADHPRILFRSTKVASAAAEPGDAPGLRRLVVTGDLELHGVTRSMKIAVTVLPGEDGDLTVAGAVKLRQTDFGIEPYSAFLGTVKVKDVVDLSFEIVARPGATKEKRS